MDNESYFDRDASIFNPTTAIYILLFTVPSVCVFFILDNTVGWNLTNTTIVTVAVLNASINSVIAYLTIRLNGKSNDTLDHLDIVIDATEELDDTLKEANDKVNSFTTDLNDAKEVFGKVGLDIKELDLEPVAEVVEKLKENKDGLNDVLDNLREIDVKEYIEQAKRIDWKQLMNAAEEIMEYIQSKPRIPPTTTADVMGNISIGEQWVDIKDEEVDWDEEPEEPEEYTPPTLLLKREKKPALKRR
jgi:hypothetical protein